MFARLVNQFRTAMELLNVILFNNFESQTSFETSFEGRWVKPVKLLPSRILIFSKTSLTLHPNLFTPNSSWKWIPRWVYQPLECVFNQNTTTWIFMLKLAEAKCRSHKNSVRVPLEDFFFLNICFSLEAFHNRKCFQFQKVFEGLKKIEKES